MIRGIFMVFPHDTINSTFVLKRMKDGKLVVMDEYEDLVCKKCGKVDEKAALARGIRSKAVVKSKRPFLGSLDDFYLLDERSKKEFTRILPDELDYYRIPSSSFFVASAKVWLLPNEADPGFKFEGDRCKACGRPKGVYLGKSPPTIPGEKQFVCINMESRQGARETWIVSKEVANELKEVSPPLTGMVLVPKNVEDGRASQ
jgi:hypothetical protein